MFSSVSTPIPPHAQILVIGGGPAGSYAAATLVREGFDVVLLEASKFPRYHIGESLVPSARHYLKFIDAEDKVVNHGFAIKPGAALKLNQRMQEGYTDFLGVGADGAVWNVVRSEFDNILLDHASSLGVKVHQNTKVVSLEFDENNKPVSATYTRRSSSDTGGTMDGVITFNYLVDATGRAGLMSTKYLKNRNFMDSLKNIAVWGYWTGVGTYGEGTTRAGAPWFEALTDETGWAWFIPLHTGVTSVGIVVNKDDYTRRAGSQSNKATRGDGVAGKKAASTFGTIFGTLGKYLGFPQEAPQPIQSGTSSSTQRYLETLELAPGLKKLLGDGKLVDHPGSSEDSGSLVHTASDYSYSADGYAGDGWRVIGDAGAFIDPFFSSGVHLAFTGALSAAVSISASIRGDCSEKEASSWHTERVATSFTRFLIVVLAAYKQMKSQRENVLSDVDEDNFDRAFRFIRPIIQGGSDVGRRLSEDELQQALDFCGKLFHPTIPEEHHATEKLLAGGLKGQVIGDPDIKAANLRLMDFNAPIVDPQTIENIVREQIGSGIGNAASDFQSNAKSSNSAAGSGCGESTLRMVLEKVNAWRVIHSENLNGVHNFEDEPLGQSETSEGWVAKLEKGRLGLAHADRLMC